MRTRSQRAALAAALVLALALALLLPSVALARAGGGHIGSPGRSGGFSGGSRSSGGFSGGLPIPIPIGGGGGGCGTIILIIVIVGIVMYVQSRNGGGSSGGEGGAIGSIMTETPPDQASFDALKAADPDFGEQAFYGRVNEMFMAIQHAWQARDMEPARRFLADQQFDVLQNGVQEYVRSGQVNKLDGMHVDRIDPVSVTAEGGYDYVRVLVTATVIDYTVDERTGELVNPGVLGDGKTPKTFQEYWTLVRKAGARTKAEATIKKCPNCGAPVTDGNYVKCAYCGTQMNDPALDWVLQRIEQV
ncbi:MAG TPA: TIM44-like domain-containing protein [Coriobacteriia bacterium]|jgi:hypothetical protein